MKQILLIILIVAGSFFLFFLLLKLLSNKKKTSPEDEEDFSPVIGRIPYENVPLSEAIERAWRCFQDTNTTDYVELDTDDAGCQLTMDSTGESPTITATFIFKREDVAAKAPEYVRSRHEGGLYPIRYTFPDGWEQMVCQIMEVMKLSNTTKVRYHLWQE